ncbi:MAG: methyl-accepting chemotaxis protein [Polyangiaceae bacterium]
MTIGRRIAIGFAIPLLLLVLIGWTVYRNTLSLVSDAQWVNHTHTVIERVESLYAQLKEGDTGYRGYIITGDDTFLIPFRAAESGYGPAADELAKLVEDNPVQHGRALTLKRLIANQLDHFGRNAKLRAEKGYEAAADVVKSRAGVGMMDEVRAAIREMKEEEHRLLLARAKTSEDGTANALGSITWGTGLAILLTGFAALFITRSIVAPTRELLEGANQIGGGNLGHRIKLTGNDELTRLSEKFNAMTENLGKTMVTADTEKAARARVENLLQTIAETAASLVSATSEILAGTTQQAAGAQEQAAAVAQTVTTVDEVVQTSEQSAIRARAVADISQKSVDISRVGRKVVDDSVQVMGTVKEQVDSSAESILALAEQAQAIGEIIATVNEIAEQTNLLALNAAIEASRAGEHGKGFGVVATEVKALADQSKKATGQVRQILGEIQKATNGAVMIAEECNKSVNQAMRVITQAGDTIKSLADIIADASQAASQISASASQQASGTAQIHQAMKNINQVTNQNLSSTRQMEQAAKDLNLLGGRLRERLTSYERGVLGPG